MYSIYKMTRKNGELIRGEAAVYDLPDAETANEVAFKMSLEEKKQNPRSKVHFWSAQNRMEGPVTL